jgi:hypothetical protein
MVEEALTVKSPFSDIAVVQVEIEDVTDKEFVQKWASTGLWSTPLYYEDALQRWPERHAVAISAIARAQPGGVVFHCIRGHDRTGMIALILLALAEVTLDEIIADYELSHDPERDEILVREQTSVREVIHKTLEGVDMESYLRIGGVSQDDLDALRRRLLE